MRNVNHLTQLDYIKVLLDEDREGEALNHLKQIARDLEAKCLVTAKKLEETEFDIPKALIKTKPQNWIFLKENWVKLVSIQHDNICLEITDGVSIKTKFKIDGKSVKSPISK